MNTIIFIIYFRGGNSGGVRRQGTECRLDSQSACVGVCAA
jgi:hypothetical protein